MDIFRHLIVREDSEVVVFAHPGSVRPQELSNSCAKLVGEDSFVIALSRDIYVIYVIRAAIKDDSVSTIFRRSDTLPDMSSQNPRPISQTSDPESVLEVKLQDIRRAQKLLKEN